MRILKIDAASLAVLLSMAASMVFRANILAYLLVFLTIPILYQQISYRDIRYLFAVMCVTLLLYVVNISYLNNYSDLAAKGAIKLFAFFCALVVSVKVFPYLLEYRPYFLRLSVWSFFFLAVLVDGGFNSYNINHATLIFVLFVVEFYFAKKANNYIIFYAVFFAIVLTTKKQVIVACLIFLLLVDVKRLVMSVLVSSIVIVPALIAIQNAKIDTGKTIVERYSYVMSDRFLEPNPYGNFRLFLIMGVLPNLVYEDRLLFGFGLERYGSIAAYESDRDVESNELGLSKFVSPEYSTDSTGSFMTDVGFMTILMQMGLSAIVYYVFFFRFLSVRTSSLRLVAIFFPFFLGGPLLFTLAFSFVISLSSSALGSISELTNTMQKEHMQKKLDSMVTA